MLRLMLIISSAFFTCFGEPETGWTNAPVSSFKGFTGTSSYTSPSCSDATSCTEMFVCAFTNAVRATSVLKDLFEISQIQPIDFQKFMCDYIKASATNLGMANPQSIAESATQPIHEQFQRLVPHVMVRVFANFAAKYLQSEGFLNPSNAASRAAAYVSALEEIAKASVQEGNPESKLKALLDGTETFFKSVDLLVADKGQTIASFFANEVKLAGEELRTSFHSSPSCSDATSCTEMFVSTFTNAVRASNVLKEVFEISQIQPVDFRKFMYNYVKASAANLGMANPQSIAESCAQPIEEHFKTLVPQAMVKVFANTAAKYLQSEGRLNPSIVTSRAAAYASALEEIAKASVQEGNPQSKLKALMDGIEKFFTSMDLLVAGKGQTIASIFANEVKLAGEELRKGKYSHAFQ